MALPAYRNRAWNPYHAQLYEAVGRIGVRVDEVTVRRVLRARHDIVHLHWPEYLFDSPSVVRAVAKGLAYLAIITRLRAAGTTVVWTVHNLAGHEQWHPRWAAWMWQRFTRRVDAYIALTAAGQEAAQERYPDLRSLPSFVIPHGHYREAYPREATRADARRLLGVPTTARVVAFFGAVRPYKNLPMLLDAFRGLPDGEDGEWRLIVAGQPWSDELRTTLATAAAQDPRVLNVPDFVPHQQVQLYLRAADLLVFPYREVLNSGSALLALSFDRPVLVPDRGAMAELQRLAGPEWVRTFSGTLDAQTLIDAMTWAETTPRDTSRLLETLSWDAIAEQTLHAYAAVRRVRLSTGFQRRT